MLETRKIVPLYKLLHQYCSITRTYFAKFLRAYHQAEFRPYFSVYARNMRKINQSSN